jgi:hypothetical protein
MSSLTYDIAARASNSDEIRTARPYFVVLCGSLILLNLCTFLYHLTAIGPFNVLSNAIGIAVILYSLVTIFRAGNHESAGRTFLLLGAAVALPSVLCNLPDVSPTDVLKYLSLYVFYAAGRCSTGPFLPKELRCLYALAALPIAFMVIGTSKVYNEEGVGYLPNANTAVLYFSAVLFAASAFLGDRVILLQLLNAALMNRIGAVLATVLAIVVWIAVPLRKEAIIAGLVVVVAALIALWLGAFDRAIAVIDTLAFVLSIDPQSVISMSYAELVQLTGTTDLSAFFRLIHWSNIWDLYTSGGIGTWLFGYGPGQTPVLTYAGLVPHNDYLRVLAEYGFFSFLVFVLFLQHIRSGLRTGAGKVLFLVLCIYFFSENLVDNFTSMALFFGYAGRLTAMRPLSDAGVAAKVLTMHARARSQASSVDPNESMRPS